MSKAIIFQNVGKQYRLGRVGTGTLQHDLNRWWQTSILGKEDPYLKIGDVNDRTTKGNSDYVWALKDINFSVEEGDVVGIIGKNGAGKSTLLKLLSHITSPSTGIIRYQGRIASLLEVGTGFHPELTARENIYMNGSIMGMTKHEIDRKLDEIVDFAGVERYLDTPVKRFSSGMTVRLGFAVAAFLEPEILVVDEVLAVGDAEFQKKAIGKMQEVSQGGGRTVLFVSHNMAAVKNICHSGVLLENGKIAAIGTAEDMVELYNKSNVIDINDISHQTSFKRLIHVDKEFEIIELNRLSPFDMDSLDDIQIRVKLKRNGRISNFNICVLITFSETNTRVGMAYSPTLQWKSLEDILEYKISISQHHLAKGKYCVDVWVNSGDVCSSFKQYDAVYETLTFNVNRVNNRMLDEWHSYWGQTCLQLYAQPIN